MRAILVIAAIFIVSHVFMFYVFWMFGVDFSERGFETGFYSLISLLASVSSSIGYMDNKW